MLRLMKFCIIASFAVVSVAATAKDANLTTEQFVQKALEAIGPAEARSAQSVRRFVGAVELKQFQGQGHLDLTGPVSLMTIAPDRVRIQMRFGVTSYQQEDFLFDNGKVNIAYINSSGQRSRMGDFLFEHESILREGLIAGPLSAANPLANLEARQAKVKYDGTKKIDGREMHQLSYYAKKNSDNLLIKLYFEPDTFRHVMTRYSWTKPLGFTSNSIETAQLPTLHYEIIESFSDFRQVDGLTLPVNYSIRFYTDDDLVGYSYDMRFSQYNKAEIAPAAPAAPSK